MSRRAINVYVPLELHARLKASGLNFSRIAREAWEAALSDNEALVSEYGPVTPVKDRTHKRGKMRRPA